MCPSDKEHSFNITFRIPASSLLFDDFTLLVRVDDTQRTVTKYLTYVRREDDDHQRGEVSKVVGDQS